MQSIFNYIKNNKKTVAGAVVAIASGIAIYKYKTSIYREAEKWLKIDKNEETKKEVKELVSKNDTKGLKKIFGQRLSFGTAGLRARMGAGYSQMNEITVAQTAQGLVRYLEEQFKDKIRELGVVIGFDARNNSQTFAEISARIFASQKIKVFYYSEPVPTPFVPFAITQLKTAAGVMVTASHNPKNDNGYKVYWDNGAQIISPHDVGISRCIEANLDIWEIEQIDLKKNPLIVNLIENQFDHKYYEYLQSQLPTNYKSNPQTDRKITYTAMHGVGYRWFKKACQACDIQKIEPVKEQVEPDPEFPTVEYPNPEEGKESLKLAIETAERTGCDLILANDPDADRIAVVEKSHGKWKFLHGNDVGILLAWWLLMNLKKSNKDIDPSKLLMVSTVVSSGMLSAFAQAEGIRYEETLTGFKWIANKGFDLEKKGFHCVFGFEESIGYMSSLIVPDKDGISAAVLISQMANYLAGFGMDLTEKLSRIHQKYGHFIFENSYFFCYDPVTISSIFNKIRNDGNYPKFCGDFPIKFIRDLTVCYDNSKPDLVPILPCSKSSQMITFTLDNGCIVTLRTSGTEPKIKYYIEMSGKDDPEKIRSILDNVVKAVIENFLDPKGNNLGERK
ncbi:phosphomannomutase 45a [Anaeramoeba ignava]|uniref:Phosphomannomutase 45a n=1 Tax=Anaeramoeba ignava TaxID=1746090 RepID=A0A9Q0L6R8_ANAIG|nr:phosphomannomutase 45a [Anaeramoeba ignava]